MAENMPTSPRPLAGARPGYSPPRSAARRSEYNSSSTQFSTSIPLAIRGAHMDIAPPPLPPPRHLPALANNSKPLWQPYEQPTVSGSVASGSSLMGGNWKSSAPSTSVPRKPGIPMLHESSSSSIKTEDEREALPSIATFQSRPLDTHNQYRSTEAYDKHQLSKLGRPKTPVRSSSQVSIENSPVGGTRLRLDTQTSLNRLSINDRPVAPESPFKTSPPLGRWNQQHVPSGNLSPGLISSTASSRSVNLGDPRSPSYDPSTAPSSFATDQNNVFSRVGSIDGVSSASLSMFSHAFEDDRDVKRIGHVTELGKSHRVSIDQGVFPGDADLDSEFTATAAQQPASARAHHVDAREFGQHRHLSLDSSMADGPAAGQQQHHHHHHHHNQQQQQQQQQQQIGQGIKRKASPSDVPVDEPAAQAARSHTPGRYVKRASPAHQSTLSQASFSPLSTASASINHQHQHNSSSSYQSANMSLAQSGIAALSDSSENRRAQSPYRPHGPFDSGVRSAAAATATEQAGMLTQYAAQGQTSATSHQEVANNRAGIDSGSGAVKPPLANIHMCNCCPKKPKKFPTLEALQAHQNEKQYYCSYCHNRFKNKNEAERHQNSLHLRKQSWSCAALENRYEKAFHPCTAVSSANGSQQGLSSGQNSGAEFDVCGYCGKQFPNYPSPDWMERSKHLTEVHKFGECNRSKKFYRADHFRQHLKHSHAGQAGKWTNMLETACLRDEPPPQPLENPGNGNNTGGPISVATTAASSPDNHHPHHRQQQQQQQSQLQASQALQAVQQQQPSYQVDANAASATAAGAATGYQTDVSPRIGSGLAPGGAGVGQNRQGYPAYAHYDGERR